MIMKPSEKIPLVIVEVKKLRLVVVEDEKPSRGWMCDRLAEFPEVELVGEADTVNTAYQIIVQTKPDGVFMDIELFGGTAFDVLERLKKNNIHVPIVVTTGMDSYTLTAINDWRDYIGKYMVKPLANNWQQKFQDSLDWLMAEKNKQTPLNADPSVITPDFVIIQVQNSYMRFYFNDLIWIETATDGKIALVTEQSANPYENMTILTLQKVQPQLSNDFIQISRQHIVNLRKVIRFNVKEHTVVITYRNQEKLLTIGHSFYNDVLDKWKQLS